MHTPRDNGNGGRVERAHRNYNGSGTVQVSVPMMACLILILERGKVNLRIQDFDSARPNAQFCLVDGYLTAEVKLADTVDAFSDAPCRGQLDDDP